MRMHNLKNWLWIGFFGLIPLITNAQHEDCRTAYVICSDSTFRFLPTGSGINDFENPNNDEGCLVTGENISAWFYFELREDMPLDSNELGFIILDTLPDYYIDYDFAIYGPNLSCDSLGSPYRCSFARLPNNGEFGFGDAVATGFKEGETDTTESFLSSDGFLKYMDVKPGDGFFLVIDFFVSAFPGQGLSAFDSTAIQGFRFEWNGSAKPWLNCIVNPNCDQVTVDITGQANACAGESVPLNTIATNTNGNEVYIWSEASGRTDLLSATDIPNPTLNLPPGFSGTLAYTVLVKEGACEHSDTITITVEDGGQPMITGDALVCADELATLSAPPGFDSYTWSSGDTTQQVMVPGGATYRLTVTTIGNSCPAVADFTVEVPEVEFPLIRGDNGICSTGRGVVILRATEGFSSYSWSYGDDSSSNSFIEVQDTLDVFLSVTDSLACVTSDTTKIELLPDPTTEIFGDGTLCEGSSDTLSFDQTDVFFVNWSSLDGNIVRIPGTFDAVISSAGTYVLTVDDSLGCRGQENITFVERALPTPSIDGEFTFCSNESTEISGPDNFTYLWSTGETTQTITVDSAFAVALLVTDTFGCEGSTNAFLDTLPLPQPEIMGRDYLCENDSVGLMVGAFESYLWSTGDTTDNITAAQADTYFVTVTDNNGCNNNAAFLVTQRVNPIPVITGDSLLCPNEVTQLETSDNFISYTWSTGSTINTTTFNTFGTVTVAVLDSFSCPGSATYDIDTLAAPVPALSGDTIYCQGDSTEIMGELGFVSYLWSSGEATPTISTDMPGTLSLTVTDNNGCVGNNSIVISERPTPMPSILGDVTFCANESGFIEAPAGFNTYTWSNGLTTRIIEIFDPGSYAVTVVDDLGCGGTGSIAADTASIPVADIFGDTYVCETGEGTLFTNPVGNYRWSNGDTTSVITIDAPGFYTVTITDQNGCSNIALASVDLQPDPNPVILGDPILCPGETTELSTALSYSSYSWSTGSLDSTTTTGFVPQVTVNVIDEFGCMGAANIDLNAVQNPNVAIDGQLAVCDGEGTLLRATEGFITYLWSTGSDSLGTIVNQNGLYTVTVTDANGCQNSASTTLTVNPNPKPDIQGNANLCRGETATLNVRDNFLSYSWSNGGTERFIQVSESGDYVVEVNSPGGCVNRDTFSVTVFEPRITPINNAVLDICDGDTLTLDAGPGFQSYQWSTGALSQSITINTGGNFNVMVVDSNGCRTNGNMVVNAQSLPQPSIIAPGVFCRGTPVSLLAGGNYRIYEWSNGDFGDIIEINRGGTYELTVTDNNGCQGTTSVLLDERDSPEVDIAGDLLICRGDTTTLTIPNDYRYQIWTDDSNDTSVVVTEPGNYGVLVLSDNGCSGSDEVQVLFRDDPLPVITGDLNKCSNETGVLDAGSGFEQYIWDTGDTTQTINYDTARIYEVRVFDDFGCDNIARIQVTAVQAPVIDFLRPPGICPGESVEVSIDSNFTSILWSNGLSTPSISLDTPGMYLVTVSDSTNCVAIDSFNLTGFVLPAFNLNGDTAICEGSTARINIDRIFPNILWSDGTDGTFLEVDTTGNYRVTVTNSDGCSSSQDRFVQVNPAPPVLPGPDTLLDCFNPSIRLGLGSENYPDNIQLTWTGPGIVDSSRNVFQPLISQSGNYSLVVVDTLTNCPSTIEQVNVVDLQYTPSVQVQSDAIVDCITGTTMIDGLGTQLGDEFIYVWTVGENDSLLTTNTLQVEVNAAALYKLQVIDTLTGCFNIDSLDLVIDPELPAALIFPVDILSCDRPTQTLTAAPAPPGSSWGYSWIRPLPLNDTIRTDSLIINQAGTYRLIVDNAGNGCVDTTSIEVTRNDTPPDISAGPDVELDCNFPEVQIGEPFAEDRWIITWSKAGEIDFFTAMKNPIISEAGEYRLEVLDPFNGCISYDTVNIAVYEESPEAIAVLVEDEKCFGDQNGSLQILSTTGGEGPYVYSFNGASFSSTTSYGNLPSGRFTLNVQDLRGCEYDTVIIVNQGLDPLLDLGPDRYITQGEIVRLTALTNIQPGGLASLQWTQPDTLSCDTCSVLRIAPIKTTEFSSVVVDTNGCIASDSVMVFVDRTKSVYIPNAFSPNGDGYNDRVTVFASPNVKQVLTFRIFQRSGDLMFQRDEFSPNDLSLGWNGWHRGKLMNSQTFVYYAQVEFDDGEIVEFEGGIHLVR